MVKALKVAMIVYGVIGILCGLAFILIPRQMGDMLGYEAGPEYVPYLLGLLGAGFIATSFFIIVAARDPLSQIAWVKLAILMSSLSAIIGLYSIMRGFVDFGQAGMGTIIDAVFTVVFLALYPWCEARRGG